MTKVKLVVRWSWKLTGKDFLEAVLGNVDSHSGRLKLSVVDSIDFFEMLM